MSRGLRAGLAGYAAGLATAGIIVLLARGAAPHAPAPDVTPASGSTWPAASASTTPPPAQPAVTAETESVPPKGDKRNISQHSAAPLSAEARSRITPLEAKLEADPEDFLARKQLAVVLLQNQQLMLAYEHASQILAAQPGDPDGLYVHGVVRLAMGHAPQAIELLDQVLSRYPNHALALDARAEAQRRIGDDGGAALTAARARQAARAGDGGSGGEVDQLLAAASDGTLLEMMRGSQQATTAADGE